MLRHQFRAPPGSPALTPQEVDNISRVGDSLSSSLLTLSGVPPPLPQACRQLSDARERKTAAGDRSWEGRGWLRGTWGGASGVGERPTGPGEAPAEAGRGFWGLPRCFWGIGRWLSCAGRRPSCAGFSFSGEVVPSPAQDFRFPARDGRSLAQETGPALRTAALWHGRTVLLRKIFVFLRGRDALLRRSEGRCARRTLSGPRFSFSCTGGTRSCTGVAVSRPGWKPSKPLAINPFQLGGLPGVTASKGPLGHFL
jgi:hypothetical protein